MSFRSTVSKCLCSWLRRRGERRCLCHLILHAYACEPSSSPFPSLRREQARANDVPVQSFGRCPPGCRIKSTVSMICCSFVTLLAGSTYRASLDAVAFKIPPVTFCSDVTDRWTFAIAKDPSCSEKNGCEHVYRGCRLKASHRRNKAPSFFFLPLGEQTNRQPIPAVFASITSPEAIFSLKRLVRQPRTYKQVSAFVVRN